MTQPGSLTGAPRGLPLLISWAAAERVCFLPISYIPLEAILEESQSGNYWNVFIACDFFLQVAIGE